MANEEIYDSSNSQLSSDEYTHDEDDDALMDVAVSKQTPTKTRKPQSSSTDTTPEKSSSAATTPRKLSADLDAGGTLKPPTTREIAERQIKQMQRNSKSNLYFKRRSIKWLNQRLSNKFNYKNQLKRAMVQNQERARRMAEYRTAKRAIELQEKQKQQNHGRRDRSSSRSRSHSRSHSPSRSRSDSNSPELICLDDTENEESPEKPKASPVREVLEKKTPPPFEIKLDLEVEAAPTENGSILDEFLTLKPVTATVPLIEETAVYNHLAQEPVQLDLTTLNAYKVVEALEPMNTVVQESTLKRRRSTTPPPTESSLPASEKRSKPLPAEDEDDDIEFMPADMSTDLIKRPTPATTPAQKPTVSNLFVATAAARYSAELNTPEFNVGSPFSLTPSNVMDFFKQQKTNTTMPTQQEQLQSEHTNSNSFKLEAPTTPVVEPMEVVYQSKKSIALAQTVNQAPKAAEAATIIQQQLKLEPEIFAVPHAVPQKIPQQQEEFLLQQIKSQQLQQQNLAQHMPQTTQQHVAQQLQQVLPQQPHASAQANLTQQPLQLAEQNSQQTLQHSLPNNLQQTQQQLPQLPQEQQQQARPKQPAEINAKPTTAPQPQPISKKNSSAELNNSNSDAVFHQRLKELYTQLDEIMGDKLRSVKPDLKSFSEEKQRLEADIKALSNLISIKEDEHNRLLHLRFTKEELLGRVERKERILIIQEILPSLLNKNCSTAELYEIHAMLLNEQNAPMPARHGPSAVEQILNHMENGLDKMNILRNVLGLQEKPTFNPSAVPLSQFEGVHNRRNSVPSMRPPPPRAAAAFERQASMRDMEDYRHEHIEELLKKRKQPQPPQSRYQQLISESRQLINSTADHGAGTSQRSRQQQQAQAPEPMDIHRSHSNLADNHFDNELPSKPLYNSSPLSSQSRVHENNSHYNDLHSLYRAEELDSMYNNRSKRFAATTNGTEELERLCQHCKRRTATHKCSGCQNQWYCSRACQVNAWDTHWKSCAN